MMDGLTDRIPTIGEAFISGLLSFFSPCILALLPVVLLYVGAICLERRKPGAAPGGWRLRVELFLHLGAFLGGFIVVLVGLAAGDTFVGRIFLLGQKAMMVLGGLFTMVIGIFMAGLIPRASREGFPSSVHRRFMERLGSAGVGAAYGLVWSPCVGPTLGSIILAAGSPDTADQGIPLLVIHGLGFGLPLLVSGYILDGFLRRIKQPWIPLVLEKTAGISLVVAGLLIATGRFLILMDGLFQTFDSWVHVLIQGGL